MPAPSSPVLHHTGPVFLRSWAQQSAKRLETTRNDPALYRDWSSVALPTDLATSPVASHRAVDSATSPCYNGRVGRGAISLRSQFSVERFRHEDSF